MNIKKIPDAINEGGYTFELKGIYPTQQAAKSEVYWMKRRGELCDDSKYRTKFYPSGYALYIWY